MVEKQMRWEAPPAQEAGLPHNVKSDYIAIAATLRERPGEWALIYDDKWLSMVAQINQGRLFAFRPAGAFEAKGVRGDEDPARGKVYARYVGTPEPDEAAVLESREEIPDNLVDLEQRIRADERERCARYLDEYRDETWNAGSRRVNGFARAARQIRGLR